MSTRIGLSGWLRKILVEKGFSEQIWWVDEEREIFAIRWTHGSCRDYDHKVDSKLFEEWAKFKGKSKPDPRSWKATFRCALSSVSSLKKIGTTKRTPTQPPTIQYQFIESKVTRRKRGRRSQPIEHESDVSEEMALNSSDLDINFDCDFDTWLSSLTDLS